MITEIEATVVQLKPETYTEWSIAFMITDILLTISVDVCLYTYEICF